MAAGDSSDEDAEMRHAAGNDEGRRESSDVRHQKAPSSVSWFPTADNDTMEEGRDFHLWGHIRRSAAGGDPRGAVSIVMDCVKPTVGKSDIADSPESSEAGHVTGDQPASHFERHQSTFHRSEGLTPPDASLSSLANSVSSQQRPYVSGDSLTHAEKSLTFHVIETDRSEGNGNTGVLAGAVAGITSGIGHGSGTDGSVAGGVVALGKGAAGDASAAAPKHVDGGYESTSSIIVRPIASRPTENKKIIVRRNNRAGGHGHAFGGGGVGMGTAMSSCRGLLCDGGGQSDDAAGSGEGG